MNARFRLLIIGLGALLVIATYSFPLWSPLLQAGEVFPFPELDPILYPAFDALPVDRQSDYLQLRRGALTLALDMATSALQPDVVVPAEQQIQPELSGQQPIRSGTWIALTPNRTAAGLATVYELPDGSRYLWLSEFSAIQAPDLRLYLSRQASAMLEELEEDEELGLTPDDIYLGRVTANVGNQRFDIPREAELGTFNSLMLYSQGLNLVYSMADL